MKLTTDTPDLLVLDDRPIILGIALGLFILVFVALGLSMILDRQFVSGLLFGGIGGGLGFLAFFAFVRRVQVVFHRPEGWVEIRRKNLFGGSSERFRIDEIDRAEVEQTSGSDGDSLYRIALVAGPGESAGHHPLTLAYTSGGRSHEAVAKINKWLGVAEG